MRAFAEAAAIFVVNVEQKNTDVGARLQYLLHQQRNSARFADARGAKNGEMLAQHLVHLDAGGDAAVLVQMADFDHAHAGILKDQPQLARADERHRIAHARV